MKLKKHFRHSNKSGFTFLETLISLSIISAMTLCIFGGVAVSVMAYTKSHSEVKKSSALLKNDTLIRNCVERVKIPYWFNSLDFAFTEHSLSFGWIDGKSSMQTFVFDEISIKKVELVSKGSKRPVGIRVKYEFEGEEHTTSVPFTTFPYGGIKIEKK